MGTKWLTTMKPSFQTEWLALPPKETHQVLEKIALLTQDPTPDAKVKKQLPHLHGKLHRIRSGDYRIFYTFEQPYISLLALRRRNEDTYDEDLDVELLGGFDIAVPCQWYKKHAARTKKCNYCPNFFGKRPANAVYHLVHALCFAQLRR